jgi:hypothetical protein
MQSANSPTFTEPRRQYLADQWGLDLDFLPADVYPDDEATA